MAVNKNLRALVDINAGIYLITMSCFTAATFVLGYFVLEGTRAGQLLEILSAVEAVAVMVLLVVYSVTTRKRQTQLETYLETVMYDSENARSRLCGQMKSFSGSAVLRARATMPVWLTFCRTSTVNG